MSVHTTSPIKKLNLACAPKAVLLIIGDATNDEHEMVLTSVKTMAAAAGLSIKTVKRLVLAFMSDGVLLPLERRGLGRRRARYRIDLPRARELYGMRKKRDTDTPYRTPGEHAGAVPAPGHNRAPYNALWKAKLPQLRAVVGLRAFESWLEGLVPVDPGDGRDALPYQLAAATKFLQAHVEQHFGALVAEVLGRPVRIIVYNFSIEAMRRRVKKSGE